MGIRIDRETGAIVGASFVVVPGLKRSLLKRIQPQTYKRPDGPLTRVAEDEFDGHIVGVFAFDRGSGIEGYELVACDDGDSWDNWTEEKEEEFCRTYRAILASSGIGDSEPLPWGHATVAYDFKNATHSLWVAHRISHSASAP